MPHFTLQEDSWYSFVLEAESTPGTTVWLKGLGQLKKKSVDLFGIRTLYVPVCSVVPRPATLLRAPIKKHSSFIQYFPPIYSRSSKGALPCFPPKLSTLLSSSRLPLMLLLLLDEDDGFDIYIYTEFLLIRGQFTALSVSQICSVEW
jgi:hypothetical protein